MISAGKFLAALLLLAPVTVRAQEAPVQTADPTLRGLKESDFPRLKQLEPKRHSLIRAAFFDGSTYEELAASIEAPLGSVKSWIRRGLMQLRTCLES